ncbi:hypothetical protein L1987_03127 [Smallanthus sonchifolius]|uniref:Uncharacterized protein n=1 Tax=Smallanthus sonchifolius TaxID=185202 RepID=A0ACB9K9X1_9ASTR|nr:hypothetical protein L1987_03127 [Smallanthus sonchifolius]
MWAKIELPGRLPYDSLLHNHRALLDEKLYFLKEAEADAFTYSIIKLDLKTWSYTEVATPFWRSLTETTCLCFPIRRVLRATDLHFTVLRGCVNIWKRMGCHVIELWRMDGDGDWTKVVTIRWLVGLPVHLMENGNWLLHYTARQMPTAVSEPKVMILSKVCMKKQTTMEEARNAESLERDDYGNSNRVGWTMENEAIGFNIRECRNVILMAKRGLQWASWC